MLRLDRRRGSRIRGPVVEGLEPRGLLSAGVSSGLAAEVHALKLNIPAIQGTIQGTVTQITQVSAIRQVVDYTAQGKANIIGDGRGSGHHAIVSKVVKNHPTNDTYSQGLATLTGTTDTVSIRYTGTGHTRANGSFTATLKGKATSVDGLHAGLSGSFTAQLAGNSRTGSFTISFSIKL